MVEKVEKILDKVELRNYELGTNLNFNALENEIKYLEKLKKLRGDNEGFIVSKEEPDLDAIIKQKKREVSIFHYHLL
jgi:dGTP triphosphohydrolase